MHLSVLLNETIEGLSLKPGFILFDGTLGSAGHSFKACSLLKNKIKIIGTDKDVSAIKRAEQKLSLCGCEHSLILSDFRNLDVVLKNLNIEKVDGILLDLGLSSDQLEDSGRGFSFLRNEPLLMTFSEDEGQRVNAETILNNWSEETIADIIYAYSDEKYSRKIAKAIVNARKSSPIKTTFDLVEIVKKAVPSGYRNGKIHFATKTFQAIRIAVNDEIGALNDCMKKGWDFLKVGGRMAIISFHSVEDREVKNFFRNKSKENLGILVNKKPIVPGEREVADNPRSRSAKLRIIEKIK